MIPQKGQIYNKAALERLSSPEQLDQLIQVVRPTSWVLLLSLVALLATFVLWGFLGTVHTRVEGQGILLGGNVYDVVPLTTGQVTRLYVVQGDTVAPGAVVAEMAQPDLDQRIRDARARLAEQQASFGELQAFGAQDVQLQGGFAEQQRRSVDQLIATGEQRLADLESQLATERELLEQGLITRQQLRATQQQRDRAQSDIEQARAERTQLASRELGAEFDLQQQLSLSRQRIAEAARLLDQLEADYASRTRVVSRQGGLVLEVMTAEGDLVSPGQPLVKVGLSGGASEPMQVVLYVPTEDGKKVEAGMNILVAPATTKPEEFGYLVGRVERVAEFPATTRSMLNKLKNDQLVRQFTAGGAPFEVTATLVRSPDTPSGYEWTSGQGPQALVRSSTPASGRITVRTQRPIDLVIPALRGAFSI